MCEEYRELLQRAHYYDISERYHDMSLEMEKIMMICNEKNLEITPIIRNLLSLAFKNLISPGRSSWRVLYTEKQKLEDKNSEDLYIVDEILGRIEDEFMGYCDKVLGIVDNIALKSNVSKDVEHKVFFLKMKGDYYRYKCEVLFNSKDKDKIATESNNAYLEAKKLSDILKPSDPIRLSLYLNYSVFNYEILGDSETACEIARSAFDSAISDVDTLSEDYYKDSTLIMQLLRDNLSLWSSKQDNYCEKNDEYSNENS